MDPRRRGPQDHHHLIYNAGGNRIHDQNPAFRGIDGSPRPMHRWYFQVNPPVFLVSPRHLLLRLARRFPLIRNIIEFCRLCSQTRQIFWFLYAAAFYWSWKLYRSLQWDVEICVTVALIYSYQTSDDLLTPSNFDVYNFILWFIHLKYKHLKSYI